MSVKAHTRTGWAALTGRWASGQGKHHRRGLCCAVLCCPGNSGEELTALGNEATRRSGKATALILVGDGTASKDPSSTSAMEKDRARGR